MYAFIEGRVCEKTTNSLVLEAGGIGYQLNCSMTTLQEAPPMGEKMRCYTYLSVREDAMELFGFATKEEKQLFLSLTGISGVGAKTALGLLGAMPLRDLNLAILLGDVNALSRAPGIGKRRRSESRWNSKIRSRRRISISRRAKRPCRHQARRRIISPKPSRH